MKLKKLTAVSALLFFVLNGVCFAGTVESGAIRLPKVSAHEEITEEAAEESNITDANEENEPEFETEEPEEAAEQTIRRVTVVGTDGSESAAIYAEPDTGSAKIRTVSAGSMLNAVSIGGEWTRIQIDDGEGYILTDHIALYTTAEGSENEPVRTVSVTVHYSETPVNGTVPAGTRITFTAHLTGFEDGKYSIQWQYTPDGGATIVNAPGETGETCSFELNEENDNYMWRAAVITD